MSDKTSRPKNKPTRADDPAWFSIAELCHVFDVTRASFHATYRALVPDDCIIQESAGRKRRIWIRARGLIDAYARDVARKISTGAIDGDAELLSGTDSPALDRLRNAKARLAELDLQQRRRELVPVSDMRQLVTLVASHLRRGIEALRQRYGEEAATIMREALADAEGEYKRAAEQAQPEGTR